MLVAASCSLVIASCGDQKKEAAVETAEKKGCCKKETAPVVESLILELPQETRFELAKKYGTNDDAGYINGILGTITRASV